ncbi:MAG: DUF411 domain-containing protein [Nitrospinae bacterium]|nr:DUF411 domain-containing protein [Nitrospinota bacterium]
MKLNNLLPLLFTFFFTLTGTVNAEESLWDKNNPHFNFDKKPEALVYYSSSCECCKGWLEHMKKNGFEVKAIAVDDVQPIKEEKKLPPKMASCHTAVIDGYIIEGHVPANDIKRLITEKPKDIVGLSVPQMPVGTPGMEMGDRKDNFDVIAFDKEGNTKVYNSYKDY